jgi:hypothetical protein
MQVLQLRRPHCYSSLERQPLLLEPRMMLQLGGLLFELQQFHRFQALQLRNPPNPRSQVHAILDLIFAFDSCVRTLMYLVQCCFQEVQSHRHP